MATIDYGKANERITNWNGDTFDNLRAEIINQGIRHRSNSTSKRAAINALTTNTKETDGIINRISYKMPRHMIYVHKGVGKETPIDKVGTTKRKPKPWFNPVIDARIDELADIVAEEMGDSIINNLKIR